MFSHFLTVIIAYKGGVVTNLILASILPAATLVIFMLPSLSFFNYFLHIIVPRFQGLFKFETMQSLGWWNIAEQDAELYLIKNPKFFAHIFLPPGSSLQRFNAGHNMYHVWLFLLCLCTLFFLILQNWLAPVHWQILQDIFNIDQCILLVYH